MDPSEEPRNIGPNRGRFLGAAGAAALAVGATQLATAGSAKAQIRPAYCARSAGRAGAGLGWSVTPDHR
jgi:hypothetical protein